MKSDLTQPEVRAAFMAQYYGQSVMEIWGYSRQGAQRYTTHYIGWDTMQYATHGKTRLSLRHISSLTEEEISNVALIYKSNLRSGSSGRFEEQVRAGRELIKRFLDRDIDYSNIANTLDVFDYLRSIGILIPYRGNSCEELIEAELCVYRKEETK